MQGSARSQYHQPRRCSSVSLASFKSPCLADVAWDRITPKDLMTPRVVEIKNPSSAICCSEIIALLEISSEKSESPSGWIHLLAKGGLANRIYHTLGPIQALFVESWPSYHDLRREIISVTATSLPTLKNREVSLVQKIWILTADSLAWLVSITIASKPL